MNNLKTVIQYDKLAISISTAKVVQKVLKAEMKIRFFFGEITFIAQYNLP